MLRLISILFVCATLSFSSRTNFLHALQDTEAPTIAPTTAAPITVAPTTAAPITAFPFTAAPTTAVPTTVAPNTAVPTTVAPNTAVPTTAAPISAAPISAAPTTTSPITVVPITVAPTTAAPITSVPTTAAPITSAPSTVTPTTIAPISSVPTTVAPFTNVPTIPAAVENVFHISMAIQFSGVNGSCFIIDSDLAVQSKLERTNDEQAALPIGSSTYWKCLDGNVLHLSQGRRSLAVSNPLAVFFNLSFVVPIGSDVDSIRNALNQTLTKALNSRAYSSSLASTLPTLFSAAATVGGPVFFGGVIIQHKIVPVYKNASTCTIINYNDVVVLSVVLKVTNVGPVAYQVNPADLKKERCSAVVSYAAFYLLSVAGIVKSRSEKCIRDSIDPVIFTCSSEGISSGNYFVSTQWMDVSAANLITGTAYPVTVTILPQNKLLTVTSSPFQVTYTSSRRRALRAFKGGSIPYVGILGTTVFSTEESGVQ
eukprot:gene22887-31189_t